MKPTYSPIHIILLVLIMLVATNLNSAWLNNIAVEFEQPDGTVLELFVTGDEFHRWAHDEAGHTIVQDLNTLYYCWAVVENDELVSSGYPVHLYTAQSVGMTPYQNVSEEKYLQQREAREGVTRGVETRAPSIGTLENIVIFIKFSDQADFVAPFSKYSNDFNSVEPNYHSVKNYFNKASGNQMNITSHFFPTQSGTTVVTYTDPHPRSYYTRAGASSANELYTRLHTLFRNAVLAIASQVPTTLNLDTDNDGDVDAIVFLIKGGPAMHTDDLLWPHMWYISYATPPYINGKRVYKYNLNLEMSNGQFTEGVSVYCHELAHTFGAPDLYRYSYSGITPIGIWCLMASTSVTPQSITAYVKQKYLNWITIPLLTHNGTYSINALTSGTENVAYRINTDNAANQYYVVEYRRNSGTDFIIDESLPGSGLLIYRVRTGINDGNREGPPDELYVYRPNGTLTANGQINQAHFSQQSGRTEINNNATTKPFLYNGNNHNQSINGGLDISHIGLSGGESMTFRLNSRLPEIVLPPSNLAAEVYLQDVTLTWESSNSSFNVYRNNLLLTTEPISEKTFLDSNVDFGTYTYAVTAVGNTEESDPSSIIVEVVPLIYNPPKNLVATAGFGEVDLQWEEPDPQHIAIFQHYALYRDGVLLVSPLNTLFYNDTNVTIDVTYNYHVTAFYSAPDGESDPSNIATAMPYNLIPILGLDAYVDNDDIVLNWTIHPNNLRADNEIIGYHVYRNNNKITPSPITALTLRDSNVPKDIEYTYGVTNVYSVGESDAIQHDIIMPLFGTVNDMEINIIQTGVFISWALPNTQSFGDIVEYRIERTDGETPLIVPAISDRHRTDGETPLIWRSEIAGTGRHNPVQTLFYTDETISPDTTYSYRVITVWGGDISGESSPITETIQIPPYPSPKELSATAGDGFVILNWTPPDQSVLGTHDSYNLYRNDDLIQINITETSFTDTNLANAIQYTYHVTAVYNDPYGMSPPSNIVVATPEDILTPANNLQLEIVGDNNILLSWQPPIVNSRAFLGYIVYRDTTPLTTSNYQQTTYSDNNRLPDILYTYSITAMYDSGESAPIVDSIVIYRYGAPTSLQATLQNDKIELNWNAPSAQNFGTVIDYVVYRDNVVIGKVSQQRNSIPTHYFDINVEINKDYEYYVTTVWGGDIDGESQPSNIVSIIFVSEKDDKIIPIHTKLLQNVPNPFNPETTIYFSVAEISDFSKIKIDIYNIRGQKINTLIDGYFDSGTYSVLWNGKDNNGNNVPSGVYFYQMSSKDFVEIKRMVLMK